MLTQSQHVIQVPTPGRGLHELTRQIADWTAATGIVTGLLTVFVRHTSASLLIQENADPQVGADLERYMLRLVPDGDPLFRHRDEGPDDMPAHVRSALTASSLSIPVGAGPAGTGHLARHLPLGAPHPATSPRGRAALDRRSDRVRTTDLNNCDAVVRQRAPGAGIARQAPPPAPSTAATRHVRRPC